MPQPIVKCGECFKQVSPSASACPDCGASISLSKWKISDKIALFSACVSLTAVCIALVGGYFAYKQMANANEQIKISAEQVQLAVDQNASTELWKRREFAATEIKEFYADRINDNILKLLDYDPALVDLMPGDHDNRQAVKAIPMSQFVDAIRNENASGDTLILRQQFEHFLASIDHFDYLIANGVIPSGELCNVFGYPLSILAGDPVILARKLKFKIDAKPISLAMHDYIAHWQRRDIYNFISMMSTPCGFEMPSLLDVAWEKKR